MSVLHGKARRWVAAVAGLLLVQFGAHAQGTDWPQRPLRLVIPGPPGGSSDVPARIFAKGIGDVLKQSVVIENRPGASGLIAAREVANAAPDGYTLLFTSGSAIAITTGMMADMAEAAKKLAPIGMLAYTPLAIAVSDSSPIQSLAQLISMARDKPDALVMANPGTYTLAHLTTELMIKRANIPMRAIAFNSFPAELVAIKNGDAAAFIDGIGPVLAQSDGKGLRILAASSEEPLPGLERYPLMKDTIPGLTADGWFGLFAPAGVPAPVVQRISEALALTKQDPQIASTLKGLGMYVRPDDPASFTVYVRSQTELWHGVLAELNAPKPKN